MSRHKLSALTVLLVMATLLVTSRAPIAQAGQVNEIDCKCVVFRLDDVQDFWLNSVQIKLINLFTLARTPLTIGIIGSQIGQDVELIEAIETATAPVHGVLTLANHSFDNKILSESEFEQQSEVLGRTSRYIEALFGIKPAVLIPPRNQFNDDTVKAAIDSGISVISASPIYGDATTKQWKPVTMLHEGSSTGKYSMEKSQFLPQSVDTMLKQINHSINLRGYAVVTMHPQEFSVLEKGALINQPNEERFEDLQTLLIKLRSAGVPVKSMTDVASEKG